VLYIGARNNRFDYSKEFKEAGIEISVLEIFPENVNFLRTLPGITVIQGDVRSCPITEHDVIFWWHGPEHIKEEELPMTVNRLGQKTKTLILGCPWGKRTQSAIYGNVHEIHQAHYGYEIFEKMGFTVECLGEKDVYGSNITSVKSLKI
jgi:hypothetical protein